MKRGVITALALVWVLALVAVAPASDSARTFINGTEAYRAGDWQTAIKAFESLVDDGVTNGQLFYNLGNAYLKNEDLGQALLWYERALKRVPDDPDLRFNYNYALTLTKDERTDTDSVLLRILFFWKYQLSHSTVRWAAIGLNTILWTTLSILAIRKKHLLRPSVVLITAATIIFTATAVFTYFESARIRHAVILPEKVAVRSGFTDTATQLFILHAGTKVRVERESDSHLLVRYTADKIGWIKKTEVGVI